jgi:hypothetical protein
MIRNSVFSLQRVTHLVVCTENLHPDVVVMKSAKDHV